MYWKGMQLLHVYRHNKANTSILAACRCKCVRRMNAAVLGLFETIVLCSDKWIEVGGGLEGLGMSKLERACSQILWILVLYKLVITCALMLWNWMQDAGPVSLWGCFVYVADIAIVFKIHTVCILKAKWLRSIYGADLEVSVNGSVWVIEWCPVGSEL